MWPLNKQNLQTTDNIVACHKCNHLIRKFGSQERKIGGTFVYFCDEHRVKWNRYESFPIFNLKSGRWDGTYKTIYYRDSVLCDENGKILP